MSAFTYLSIYICVIYTLSIMNMYMATSSSLVLKLIHPNLVPKLHNNFDDALPLMEHSSKERYKYLASKIRENSTNEGITTKIVPNIHADSFHVNFSIGEPPVWQIAAIDSASYLLWVPCHPNSQSEYPLYDPFESSTYHSVSCDSHICGDLDDCKKSRNCSYFILYGDDSTSSGDIGLEKFRFWSTLDNATRSFSDIVFGCDQNNRGPGTGILGLNAHRVSLVSQLGSRFSYCIGNISDTKYEHNRLVIGGYANMEGATTPLETNSNGLYFVKLEGISVGDKRLDIDPEVFRRTTSENGVIIDSGATISYLPESAYYKLSEEMQILMDGLVPRVYFQNQENGMCYKGNLLDQLKGLPTVTFHFAGEDADFFVEREGMFRQYGDVFCLAVEPVDEDEFSVIGLYAQQYQNMGFDLKNMIVHFENVDDCEALA